MIAALTEGYEDPRQYFVDRLAEAVGTVAAAFYPDALVRGIENILEAEKAVAGEKKGR